MFIAHITTGTHSNHVLNLCWVISVEVQGPCWAGPTPHWPRMTFTPESPWPWDNWSQWPQKGKAEKPLISCPPPHTHLTLYEATCSFPGRPGSQNNHREIDDTKTIPVPLRWMKKGGEVGNVGEWSIFPSFCLFLLFFILFLAFLWGTLQERGSHTEVLGGEWDMKLPKNQYNR